MRTIQHFPSAIEQKTDHFSNRNTLQFFYSRMCYDKTYESLYYYFIVTIIVLTML